MVSVSTLGLQLHASLLPAEALNLDLACVRSRLSQLWQSAVFVKLLLCKALLVLSVFDVNS